MSGGRWRRRQTAGRREERESIRTRHSAVKSAPSVEIREVRPRGLDELSPAFVALEAGHSVAVLPPAAAAVCRAAVPVAGGPWMGVTSSGSTGTPKLVWRRWPDFKAAASRQPSVRGWVWAAPFDPWSFAGVQVAVQAWANAGRAVSLRGDGPGLWRTLQEERVDALSATPTFFDLLLQNEPGEGAAWTPRQVSLGGEPLRPALGQRLSARWPGARFAAIYAAAEFGVLLKTQRRDGWYEVDALNRRGLEWRVPDGVLEVRDERGWRSTGDQVEVRAGLLRVIGRADQVANVAGTKVNLAEVGRLAEEVPGVARAVAVAESSPVTGQVVCLRFTPAPGEDPQLLRRRLEAHLFPRLSKAGWPRDWVVDELAPAQNAKRRVR